MSEEYDFNYKMKFVIIGDSCNHYYYLTLISAVGKSCILMQFNEKKYRSQHEVTLGVDLASAIMDIEGNVIKLLVWDTVL